MIAHLADLLAEFPGEANRTRCFTHILNLVARSIMRQFDAPKTSTTSARSDWDEGGGNLADALADLERELEDEDDVEMGDVGDGEGIDGEDLPDGREGMSEEEIKELEESVKPVRRILTKVCHTHHALSSITLLQTSTKFFSISLVVFPYPFYSSFNLFFIF